MEINLDIIDHILNNNYELSRDFEKYGKIYLNTTENIAGILEGLDIKGKKVLSVAGSGDQMLNAYYHGAEEVSIFDINPLAAAQAELKLVAAQKLDYNEFYHFFTPVTNSVLDVDTFNKLSKYLTDECANFFEYLYSNYDSILIFNKVFHKFFPTKCILERINSYMGEENFKQLKEKIDGKKIDYIESGLVELIIKLKDLYDIILLSNISDSVDEIQTIDSLKNYKRFIHSLKHLNKDGIIQCGYIYNSYIGHTNKPSFANNEIRRKIFTPDEFTERDIKSYQFHSSTDKVITFQKKRRKVS